VSDKREIGATADQIVEVTLAQEAVARPTPARYGRPPPAQPATTVATSVPAVPPATTTAAPATGTGDAKNPRPKREIDRKDPYSK